MVGPHAGIADTAKRGVMVDHMPTPVVDGHAAGMGLLQQLTTFSLVVTEAIQGQGAWPGIDECDGFLGGVIGHHRQNGAENLFLHDAHIRRAMGHHVQGHVASVLGRIIRSASNDFCTFAHGIGQQFLDAGEMSIVDDPGVIVVVPNRAFEQLGITGLHGFDKRPHALVRHQGVIG